MCAGSVRLVDPHSCKNFVKKLTLKSKQKHVGNKQKPVGIDVAEEKKILWLLKSAAASFEFYSKQILGQETIL